MIETTATVERNDELAPGYRLLTLEFDQEIKARPGQFAMLKPHLSLEPLLRRALAVYRAPDLRRLSFLYQVLGRGTQALSTLKQADRANALIPLGNDWPLEDLGAADRPHSAIVVAGGI
ncbi:MAG TPA: hypothetical protein VLD57_11295 [Blastocatellia bacterium]|nr:hypothetical protein [Blastocatellia bacterium]